MSTATTSATLTEAISLTPVPPQVFDEAYEATTQPCPWPKAYGGDLVAQAATAVMRSTGADRRLHSMHSYFLRPAQIGATVRYEVERLRDGRGYSTRQVRAFQDGKAIYAGLASFHVGEPGGSYRGAAPEGVPAPERLPPSAEVLRDAVPGTPAAGTMTDAAKAYWSGGRSFDLRHVPGPVYLTVDGAATGHQAVWIKPFDALRDVPGLTAANRDQAALAYVCDYTILEPILRVLGLPWARPGLVTASLDHAMWFHRAGRVDGWLLYLQEAVAIEHGRGLGTGRFFTRDGVHLATVAQEGLVRAPD
ncbi:acyl-CoA thioesterase-2 [Krasilnikovia cinnamomea]|uniref:Acyl-CoA thioesterase-2 n=1 Tax=Krasilnikovia cinnamomea TaxID=349313 RepID=A0A4Q7ZSJ0_9ACTN|nr:acyl-CoA thioesterase domain-containing protein [Krasilnikovia cinnamomea]RZU53824.1 acyl-CoA thioesterase-2 [Krasilnikovia cinnamomea]